MKKPVIIVIAIVIVLGIIAAFAGGNEQEAESVVGENNVVTDNPGDTEEPSDSVEGFTVPYGELEEVNVNDLDGKLVAVFKVQSETQLNNQMTIDQNYYNVEDLIQQGASQFDEIQYWALAQSTDGEDVKYISFTMNKELIDKVAAGNFPINTLGDYVDDLYILPSLLN